MDQSRLAVQIRGSEQLTDLARRLKESGDKELRRDLLRGLRQAVRPTLPKISLHAAAVLPQRGGLAEVYAAKPLGTRATLSAKRATVRVVSRGTGRLRDVNAGKLRHPVFKRDDETKPVWVSQTVEPEWFDGAIKKDTLRLRLHVVQVVRRTARKIEGS